MSDKEHLFRRHFLQIAGLTAAAGCIGPAVFAAEKPRQPIELCVRGDDMGHSLDVNLGFIKAHVDGILTSASLMAPAQYFDDAIARCKAHPKLALGIHTTLMAAIPMRPVLSPEQVPSLVAPDGYFHRCLEDFVKAEPKADEVEKEIRAQIKKCLDTGLRFVYFDSHIATGEKERPDIGAIYPRLADEYRLLLTMQGHDGQYTAGAKYVSAGDLETWGTQRLPDGTLAYFSGPDMPAETRTQFLQLLQKLQPGTWYTVCHPGLYARRQMQSVELLCSPEVKEIIRLRGVRLISFRDLWNHKYGGDKSHNGI